MYKKGIELKLPYLATLEDFIKQAEEAAAALNLGKRNSWDYFCMEVRDAKGKTPNSKKKKVFDVLSNEVRRRATIRISFPAA